MILLKELGAELGMNKSLPSSVFVENQACIAMTKKAVNSLKVDLFAIGLHFLQKKIDQKVIENKFRPIENATADVLMNALGMNKFQRFSEDIAGKIATQRDL